MKKKLRWVLTATLICSLTSASAQITNDGRVVKRIVFDKEQVNIVYDDGAADVLNEKKTIIKNNDETTGIKQVATATPKTLHRNWYSADGRVLRGEPQQKGIYMLRENNKVKKTIKK